MIKELCNYETHLTSGYLAEDENEKDLRNAKMASHFSFSFFRFASLRAMSTEIIHRKELNK